MSTYTTTARATSATRDFASRGVPIVLAIGVAALVFLPNLSGTLEDGYGNSVSDSVGFSDLRKFMDITGYGWAYYLAFVGVIAAAAAAYFLPQPNSNLPRKAIITIGSLLGLAMPVWATVAFHTNSIVSIGKVISIYSFGLYIFIAACIAAAIMGLVSESDAPSAA